MLGEFEYVLMTVAASLGESAYGAAIREEIEKVAGRSCSIGALYTTIERLEKKGMHAATEFYEAMMRVSRNASWATGKQERAS